MYDNGDGDVYGVGLFLGTRKSSVVGRRFYGDRVVEDEDVVEDVVEEVAAVVVDE